MRTTPSLQQIASSLFTILIPLVFFVAQAHSVAAQTCPLPFVKVGNECVLTADKPLLDHIIIPASNTILNCQNHRLVARAQGKMQLDKIIPSKPEVGA